jgi:hypothetical protein
MKNVIMILKDMYSRTLQQISDDEKDIKEWEPPIPYYKKRRLSNNKEFVIQLEKAIKILNDNSEP